MGVPRRIGACRRSREEFPGLPYAAASPAGADDALGSAEILENTRKLAPKVAARAEEIAKLRRLPLDLVDPPVPFL